MTTQLDLTKEILKEVHYQRYNHPSPLVQRRMEAVWLKGHKLSTNTKIMKDMHR